MCLIVLIPQGTDIPEKAIRASWTTGNDDGAGFAFSDGSGVVEIRKPFWKLKGLNKALKSVHSRVSAFSDIVVHLRFATHGTLNADNTHPFSLDKGNVALAHNGILEGFGESVSYLQDTESDTRHFCRVVLGMREAEQLGAPGFLTWLEKTIGAWNKLALLFADGRSAIVNEDSGEWREGCWFSAPQSRRIYQSAASYSSYCFPGERSSDADMGWIRNSEGGYTSVKVKPGTILGLGTVKSSTELCTENFRKAVSDIKEEREDDREKTLSQVAWDSYLAQEKEDKKAWQTYLTDVEEQHGGQRIQLKLKQERNAGK